MGRYFNPVNILPKVGRRLIAQEAFELFQLRDGEFMIGCYGNLYFKCCPWIFNEEEFHQFESQYNDGEFVTREFYAISETDFNKYIDF